MAVTTGSFGGSPDKHIVSGKASGPSATGDYSDLSSAAGDSDGSADDAKAKAIYGDPGDGTRMHRVGGIVDEALSASPNGISGADNANEAFIDGDTVGGFGKIGGVESGGATPGGDPGFPGLPDTPAAQGNDVKAGKAVTAASSVSNNPAVQGSPGFPGLP